MHSVADSWNSILSIFKENKDNFQVTINKDQDEFQNISKLYSNQDIRQLTSHWIQNVPYLDNDEQLEILKTNYQKFNDTSSEPGVVNTIDIINNNNLTLKSSKIFGRTVVANKAFEENTNLCIERAFSHASISVNSLEASDIQQVCSNCCRANSISVSCSTCFRVGYCNDYCRKEDTHLHQYECEGYRKGIWYDLGISHLSVRTVLSGIVTLIESLCKVEKVSPLQWKQILKHANMDDENFVYGQVLALVTNFDKMNEDDFYCYSLTATMLVAYLKYSTSFFKQSCFEFMDNMEHLEIIIGSLLLRHMGQIISNAHTMYGITMSYPLNCSSDIDLGMLHCSMKSDILCTGLFPQISLFNHSCDPNIYMRVCGKYLQANTNRYIGLNEEIFNCYCPNYTMMSRATRQEILKQQYFFDCKCSKCASKKDADRLMDKYYSYVCQNCKCSIILNDENRNWWKDQHSFEIICKNCKSRLNVEWYKYFLAALDELNESNSQRNFKEALRIYRNSKVFMTCHQHEQLLYMAQILLTMSIPLLKANGTSEIAKLLVDVAENYVVGKVLRFSKYSLEYFQACTFLIDLVALEKHFGGKRNLEKFNEMIEPAIDIVSNEIKSIVRSIKQLF